MATVTDNFNFIKPQITDNVSPSQYNDNFDEIDKILFERTKDYVVDQGEFGNSTGEWSWTFRKWNSGIAEIWGYYKYSVDVLRSHGGGIYSGTCDLPRLPFTLTKLKSRLLTEGQQSYIPHWICGDSIAKESVTNAGKCYIYSTATGKMGGTISIEIKGTWK